MKKLYRGLSFLLMFAILALSMPESLTLPAYASSGGGTGYYPTSHQSSTSQYATSDELTAVRFWPSIISDETSSTYLSSYDRQWGDTDIRNRFSFLMQLYPDASVRKNYNIEACVDEGGGGYGGWQYPYIEDYESQIAKDADASYFYNQLKQIRGMNPAMVDSSSNADIGDKLRSIISGQLNSSNKEKFVSGYYNVLKIIFPQYEITKKSFDTWYSDMIAGGGAASIGAVVLLGFHNGDRSAMWSNGEAGTLMSTTTFLEDCKRNKLNRTSYNPYNEELVLKNKSTLSSNIRYNPYNLTWLENKFSNISNSIFPRKDSTGVAMKNYGGWGYYSLGDVPVVGAGFATIEESYLYQVGDSETQGAKYGQDGIVAVKNIDSRVNGKVPVIDVDQARPIDLEMKAEATSTCDTPTKNTAFSLSAMRYRIKDMTTGKYVCDWQYGSDLSSKTIAFSKKWFTDETAYKVEAEAIYKTTLGSNYKPVSAGQNLLTVSVTSLKSFIKNGTLNNNLVDDRWPLLDSTNQAVALLHLNSTPVKFATSLTGYGNGVLAGKTYTTKYAQTTLSGADWNTWNTTQHDASVWLSRASVNDVVRLASWVGNGTGITSFLVNTGKFLNSNTGRGTQPKMTSNGVAGFVRSNSASQYVGTTAYSLATINKDGVPANKEYTGVGYVTQGAIDTQVGSNFARYTPKNTYVSTAKGMEKGIQSYENTSSASYSVYTGKTLYVNPEVTMQYEDLYGNTGNVVTAGDKMRSIPVIAYLSFDMGVDSTKTTVTSTAIANDVRAKALSNQKGGLPVYLAGGGLSASFEGGTISWKTYVLDVSNASLRSAWGNANYDPQKIHDAFVAGVDVDDLGVNKRVTKKTMTASLSGVLNIGASPSSSAKTIPFGTSKAVNIDLTNGGSASSSSQTVYNLTIRKGKITDYGGLPTDVAEKMKLPETIAQAFETNGGTNGWYDEDSTALCVRCFESSAQMPKFAIADKIPLDMGARGNADKNAAWTGGVCSVQAKVSASTKLNYQQWISSGHSDSRGNWVDTSHWSGTLTKPANFSGTSAITKASEFILPNKTVLDINQ